MDKKNKTFKVIPLGDRVIVKPQSEIEAKRSSSGIFIPETVKKEKSDTGVVIAVGEGHYENGKLIPVPVEVGDTIMFSKYAYEEIKVEGEDYFIVKGDTILAIIK